MAQEVLDTQEVKTIRRLTSILNGGELTQKEFIAAFEQVVTIVLNIEKRIVGNNLTAQTTLEASFETLKSSNKDDLEKFKKSANAIIDAAIKSMYANADARLTRMEGTVGALKDGKDADEENLLARLQSSIPTVEDILKYLPKAGTAVRDSLELLSGDERLDVSAIRGMDKLRDEILAAQKSGKPIRFSGATRGFFVYIGGVKKGIIQTLDFVAGTNMAIAYSKVNGRDTITFNASGGGAGGISVETPPEPPFVDPDNSANSTVAFTVSAQPKWIVSDGTTYYEGAGYSYSAGTGKVTMDVAPSSFIRAII